MSQIMERHVLHTLKAELLGDKWWQDILFSDPPVANKPPLRSPERDKNVWTSYFKWKRRLVKKGISKCKSTSLKKMY